MSDKPEIPISKHNERISKLVQHKSASEATKPSDGPDRDNSGRETNHLPAGSDIGETVKRILFALFVATVVGISIWLKVSNLDQFTAGQAQEEVPAVGSDENQFPTTTDDLTPADVD